MNVQFAGLDPNYAHNLDKEFRPILCEDTKGIICFDADTDKVLAAAVLDQWTRTSVQGHILIKSSIAIRRGFLQEVFNYVFNTCDRRIFLGLTPGDNLKALKFNEKLGFRTVYEVEDGYDVGVPYVVVRMDKADCRWIEQDEPVYYSATA